MKILALESSARAASCAVLNNGELLGEFYQASGLTHSRTLLAMAESLLKSLGLSVSDMDCIAAARGPGSFTGIRIGVSAAKGLAWAAEKPAAGISTLAAMAKMSDYVNGIVCPVMDARRGQVYNAKFEISGGVITRLCEDRAVAVGDIIEEAKQDGKTYFLVGDGAELCYNAFKEAGVPARIAPKHLRLQRAFGVGALVTEAELIPSDDLVPNYLRLSQAERERLEKEKNN